MRKVNYEDQKIKCPKYNHRENKEIKLEKNMKLRKQKLEKKWRKWEQIIKGLKWRTKSKIHKRYQIKKKTELKEEKNKEKKIREQKSSKNDKYERKKRERFDTGLRKNNNKTKNKKQKQKEKQGRTKIEKKGGKRDKMKGLTRAAKKMKSTKRYQIKRLN